MKGSFHILGRVGKVAYKVESHLEIQQVFHVSQLKTFNEDKEDEQRRQTHQAPTPVTKTHEHSVEEIMAHRVIHHGGVHLSHVEYLVK
ncbi:unnamed protein product [Linum trigynum]|uniref:Tf2-1-like SH3-like domain-containing protein n=1 Tax=Linum trigynum TaxID=586398 RepID=A0AAV2FPB4_9ROSI